jgi:hypothetical protein
MTGTVTSPAAQVAVEVTWEASTSATTRGNMMEGAAVCREGDGNEEGYEICAVA